MPMHPSPWAETVSPPRVVSLICVLLRCRTQHPAIGPDLGVEHVQALLLLDESGPDAVSMLGEQVEPLLLTAAGPDEFGVALHVLDAHPGRPQPGDQDDPVEVPGTEAAPAVRAALDAVEEADALVPAQRVLAEAALAGHLSGAPGRRAADTHAIDSRSWSALQRKLIQPLTSRTSSSPSPVTDNRVDRARSESPARSSWPPTSYPPEPTNRCSADASMTSSRHARRTEN